MRTSFRQLGRRALPALPLISLLLTALALGGCDTAAERAEAHYQRGMALLAAGDVDRAQMEFRNVFRLTASISRPGSPTPGSCATRATPGARSASTCWWSTRTRAASRGSARLTDLALQHAGLRHRRRARRASAPSTSRPGRPQVRALKATVDSRHPDDPRRGTRLARGVVAENPGSVAAHMVLIADRMEPTRPRRRSPATDAALATIPGDEGLHLVRLAALEQLATTRHRRRAEPDGRSSSPTTPACARRWCNGSCAPATPPAPRRCCAPRRRATPPIRSRR